MLCSRSFIVIYFTYSRMYLSITISQFIPPCFPSANLKFVSYICDSSSSGIVIQSCPNLCNLTDCSLPVSFVHGILQARILKWVAIPFSRGSSWPRDWIWISCTAGRFFTIWATREAPECYKALFTFSCFGGWDLSSTTSGLHSSLLHWKHGVLTTGLPGKIPLWFYLCFISSSVPFFLDSICKWYHIISVFVWLIQYDNLWAHPRGCWKWHYFILFYGRVIVRVCGCVGMWVCVSTTSSLSTPFGWWIFRMFAYPGCCK